MHVLFNKETFTQGAHMKIGIITLNGNRNYGNKLQNYALQKFLKSLSDKIEVDTIWYTKDNYILNQKVITLRNLRRFIFNRHNYRRYFFEKYLCQ